MTEIMNEYYLINMRVQDRESGINEGNFLKATDAAQVIFCSCRHCDRIKSYTYGNSKTHFLLCCSSSKLLFLWFFMEFSSLHFISFLMTDGRKWGSGRTRTDWWDSNLGCVAVHWRLRKTPACVVHLPEIQREMTWIHTTRCFTNVSSRGSTGTGSTVPCRCVRRKCTRRISSSRRAATHSGWRRRRSASECSSSACTSLFGEDR